LELKNAPTESYQVGPSSPAVDVDDEGTTKEDDVTDRLIAALARPPEPSPFDRHEPTLDNALLDADLFAVHIAPYGELVENGSAELEVESANSRPLDAAASQLTAG
jgi:hypothetical protein